MTAGLYLRSDDERVLRDAWGQDFDAQLELLQDRVRVEMREADLANQRRRFVVEGRMPPRTDPALVEEAVMDRLGCELQLKAVELRAAAARETIDGQFRGTPPADRPWPMPLHQNGVVSIPIDWSWAEVFPTWVQTHIAPALIAELAPGRPSITVRSGLTSRDAQAVVDALQAAGPITATFGRVAVLSDILRPSALEELVVLVRGLERFSGPQRTYVRLASVRPSPGAPWIGSPQFAGQKTKIDLAGHVTGTPKTA